MQTHCGAEEREGLSLGGCSRMDMAQCMLLLKVDAGCVWYVWLMDWMRGHMSHKSITNLHVSFVVVGRLWGECISP